MKLQNDMTATQWLNYIIGLWYFGLLLTAFAGVLSFAFPPPSAGLSNRVGFACFQVFVLIGGLTEFVQAFRDFQKVEKLFGKEQISKAAYEIFLSFFRNLPRQIAYWSVGLAAATTLWGITGSYGWFIALAFPVLYLIMRRLLEKPFYYIPSQ